jgi:hypothetical protein
MSKPYQARETLRAAGRGLTGNHSRAVGQGLTGNHSRAVRRDPTGNHSHAVAAVRG